jgi:hypothetical protein
MTGYCAATEGKRSGDTVALELRSIDGRRESLDLQLG